MGSASRQMSFGATTLRAYLAPSISLPSSIRD